MKVKQILDGLWDVVGYGSDGQTLNLKATVPGMIHVDLEREGIIPPMFWRDNEKLCQWVENRTWEYSTTFIVEDDKPLKNAFLNFDGLDTYACITLNGHHVASTDNGLMAYSFDVSKYIQKGKNHSDSKISFSRFLSLTRCFHLNSLPSQSSLKAKT